MKHAKLIAIAFIAFFGLTLLAQYNYAPAVKAAPLTQDNPFDRGRRKECTLGTMRGAHGYTYSGYVMGSYIAIAGSINFDEQGIISGTYNGTLGGNPLKGKLAGQITVESDCTGKVRIDLPIAGVSANGTFVIVNDGKETLFTSTDTGIAVTGTTKKL